MENQEQQKQPKKQNNIWLGTLAGALMPLVFFMLYYLFRFGYMPFSTFIRHLLVADTIIHVLSLAVFPNMGLFMLFVRGNRLRSGRGVLLATIIYVVVAFIVKLL
ncbi:hypothetical protein [Prolixibacter sp. SD074]|jgi:hypothetical protein|uniref:hypothetical protein n=1 Tax=Prolixibacter sp. SD074 TaxID=2652391 RepID=UPI00126E5FDC|nr:hypothetical protein [Prolixibacter sp. SD074]GET29891.1 hypothetical protein SD074_20930 [Prolixibacter sp. SD074]